MIGNHGPKQNCAEYAKSNYKAFGNNVKRGRVCEYNVLVYMLRQNEVATLNEKRVKSEQ